MSPPPRPQGFGISWQKYQNGACSVSVRNGVRQRACSVCPCNRTVPCRPPAIVARIPSRWTPTQPVPGCYGRSTFIGLRLLQFGRIRPNSQPVRQVYGLYGRAACRYCLGTFVATTAYIRCTSVHSHDRHLFGACPVCSLWYIFCIPVASLTLRQSSLASSVGPVPGPL